MTTSKLLPTPRAGNPGSRPNQKGGKILAEEIGKLQDLPIAKTSNQLHLFSQEAFPASLFPPRHPQKEKVLKMKLKLGIFCTKPSEQISELPKIFDRDADEISRLYVRGIISEGETRKARIRLVKKIEKYLGDTKNEHLRRERDG
jgi:hypothetical protein